MDTNPPFSLAVLVSRLRSRLTLPESMQMGIAAVGVGLLAGAGVWAFKQLISLFEGFMFHTLAGTLAPLGRWSVAFLPILGGLAVGLAASRWIGREKYHGVPGIIEACALAGGRLPYQKMPIRVTLAAISIGSGASVGPEDPSVQVGANFGSLVGKIMRFSEDRVRTLVAGGAAAGIAAAFNAPIAGVFFALEVLLGELSNASFAFAAISAVISSIFTQAVSGSQPAFLVPAYSLSSAAELPLYLVLGLLAGPLAAGYIRLIYFSRATFSRLAVPAWLKPAIAGVLVGVTGIFLPQIFGVGYSTIEGLLGHQNFPIHLLLFLLIAKLILTPASIGGGFVGGVFAPALFLGAVLGGLFGKLAGMAIPGMLISPPAFAMVGMAAVLAGTVHAPLTAILLLFEMTRDYHIILPLMFSVAVSLLVSRWIQRESVYRLPLALNGIQLENGRDIEVMAGIRAGEVMNPDLSAVQDTDLIPAAIDVFTHRKRHGMPVLDRNGRLVGMLTLQDLDASQAHPGWQNKTVGEICSRNLVIAYPDETVDQVMRRMSSRDIGRLPVVDRDDPTKLIGMLRRSDVIRAYDLALMRRASRRHHVHQERLGILAGVEVHEIAIERGSDLVGKRIKHISWPKSAVISSIRRGQTIILPHGETMLRVGDVLVVVTEDEGLEVVQSMCCPDSDGQGPGG